MKPQSEYANVQVPNGAFTYRVAFHRPTGRVMIVARKTKHGEAPIFIEGRRARPIIAEARKLL